MDDKEPRLPFEILAKNNRTKLLKAYLKMLH